MNNVTDLNPAWYQQGVGPAPARLDTDGRRAWDDLVSMAPPGRWQPPDTIMLELMADTVARMRTGELSEEWQDLLADLLARFLLGPESFDQLLGIPYIKRWPWPE